MNSRFEMYRYHGDDSRYQIQMTLSQGTMDTKLETDISVIDGKAEITEYNSEVSMLRVSGPRVAHERVKLKFEDKDYEGSPSAFQEYLAEVSSATLWMNGIANNKRADVDIIQYDNVTKESVGILYHMMNNMDIEPIPTELRGRLSPECLRIKLGDGEHKVSVLRPEAKVDGERLEERFNAIEMHNCHIHTPERLGVDDKIHLQMLQQLVSSNPEPSPDDTVRRIDILSVAKEYDDKICVIDGWNRGLCDTKFHFEFWPKYDSAKLKLEGRPLRGVGAVMSIDDVSKRKFDGERNLRDISDYEKRNTDEVMRTLLEDGFESIDEGKDTAVAKRHIRVEDLNLDGLSDECAEYIRDMYR